ncbi:MAG: M20/M25/M40 family metallo-hydrolase [Candidatus Theseobacter exili]|nr:M20/M25/M40 family metallo-hydrolase [Candidatus Theseobacter exili]
MKENRLIETFIDLVEISSPSGCERGVADYIKDALGTVCKKIVEDTAGEKLGGNAGNVTVFIEGSENSLEPLIFCAHMDCVVPCENVVPVKDGDIIKSNGDTILGADDKAGIAMLIETARVIKEDSIKTPDIYYLFTISEEVGLHGAKNMNLDNVPKGYAFVLDGESTVGTITVASPNSEKFRIRVKGKAAHAGIEPERGVNAIQIASKAIAKLPMGRIDKQTSINIGKIHGGHARNVVPDNVVVEGEIRSFSKKKLDSLLEKIESIFSEEAEIGLGLFSLKHESEFTGFQLSDSDDVVKIALEGARRKDIKTKTIKSGGGSDANVFNEKGISAVVLAIGFENAHTKSEQINITNLKMGVDFIMGIIEASGCAD